MRWLQTTEWVGELPGGLIDSNGLRLAQAELRPLTGADEEWLADRPGIANSAAVSRLLSACLVRVDDAAADLELVRGLLVGDRDYLMLQLRRITLGNAIHAVVGCPACAAKMDVDFAVEDIAVDVRPQVTRTHTLDCAGRAVQFRLPVGADQEVVSDMELIAAGEALLDLCLLDDGGAALSVEDREAVIAAMDRLAPKVDLDLSLTCPECGHAFEAPFDMPAFFLQEMRMGGERLLREAHLLALYYHWSEEEILGLRRDRRRAYLSMLNDSLRSE